MKIKANQEIEVRFIAKPLEDTDSTVFMDWLFNNIPDMRVSNPSYRELGTLPPHHPTEGGKMNLREEIYKCLVNETVRNNPIMDKTVREAYTEPIANILSLIREAVEEAKPKEYGEVNTFSEVIENIDGFRKGVSAYHDALMEQLNK